MHRKRLLVYSLSFVTALLAIVAGVSLFMLRYALHPKRPVMSPNIYWEQVAERYPYQQAWADSIAQPGIIGDTTITSTDGLQLHAIYIPAAKPTARTAIILHGYGCRAEEMLHIGYLYHRRLGMNILLPDLRAHGLSEGKHITMGWEDKDDIPLWSEVADQLFGDSTRQVIHGISMGAATTMMSAGIPLPPQVRVMVEDCGYTSVWDEFKSELRTRFSLHPFPLMYTTSLVCRMAYGWSFTEASAVQQISNTSIPMLFIHGTTDSFVPTEMVYTLYAAHPGPKNIWMATHSAHAQAYEKHPKMYTRQVRLFVEKFLK